MPFTFEVWTLCLAAWVCNRVYPLNSPPIFTFVHKKRLVHYSLIHSYNWTQNPLKPNFLIICHVAHMQVGVGFWGLGGDPNIQDLFFEQSCSIKKFWRQKLKIQRQLSPILAVDLDFGPTQEWLERAFEKFGTRIWN